jgi:hypothetical protein
MDTTIANDCWTMDVPGGPPVTAQAVAPHFN